MKNIIFIVFLTIGGNLTAQFNCQSTKSLSSIQNNAPINYNLRSDTADLQKLQLTIDSRDFGNGQMQGIAKYQLYSKLAFSSLRFDLLAYMYPVVYEFLSATRSSARPKTVSFLHSGQKTVLFHHTWTKNSLDCFLSQTTHIKLFFVLFS